MSKVQELRVLVNQRLSAAAEEIFELFERTILEYEEKLCGSKENQHKQMITVYNHEDHLLKTGVQQLSVSKKEVSLELQEDSPEPPHIKEEQEEVWSQDGEQLQGMKEADSSTVILNPVPVKSEEGDREKPPSSQSHENQTEKDGDAKHVKTEDDGEDCEGSEPDGNLNPDSHLQHVTHVKPPDSPQCQTNHVKWYFDNISEVQSGLDSLQNIVVFVSHTGETIVSSSESATNCGQEEQLQKQRVDQTEANPFRCSICGKRFPEKNSLINHRSLHSEQKRFSCSVCNKKFYWRKDILTHMRIHTGEKPYSCSLCGMRFAQSSNLVSHLKVHTGEKPFACSICKAHFSLKKTLDEHLRTHSGEKPFNCVLCGKRFSQRGHMRRHLAVHTGEKSFRCSVCGKGFAQNVNLKKHLTVHTRKKPFSCDVCVKAFTRLWYLKKHKCLGESSANQQGSGAGCEAISPKNV